MKALGGGLWVEWHSPRRPAPGAAEQEQFKVSVLEAQKWRVWFYSLLFIPYFMLMLAAY